MEVAYYPGCSGHGMSREYQLSTAVVCRHLGLVLHEVEDWNCCGASAAHSLNHSLALELNFRNLRLVEKMGLTTVTTPCAGCYSRLKTAESTLKESIGANKQSPQGSQVEASHVLQFLVEKVGLETIAQEVKRPLSGLRLAAYYGCLLTRPRGLTRFDDPEQPRVLDDLLKVLGAETVNWSHKAECCGAGMAACQTEIVVQLSGEILEAAKQAGAEAIVVGCPLCQTNLDTRQSLVEAERGVRYGLPIMYFTQLMGLAFGHSVKELGLNKLLTSPLPLLRAKGLY